MIKALLGLFVSLCAAGYLLAKASLWAGETFLADALQLHGQHLTAHTITAADSSLDWRARTVEYRNVSASKPNPALGLPTAEIGSIRLQLAPAFKLDPSQPGLVPPVIPVEELAIQGLRITYDADSEGSNLLDIRKAIADAASNQASQRLNAAFQGSQTRPQQFTFETVTIKGIEINARSQENLTRQQIFPVSNLTRTGIGMREGGLTLPELTDRLAQQLSEDIHKEALARGIIEPPRPAMAEAEAEDSSSNGNKRSARQRATKSEASRENDESGGDGDTVKGTAKGVGTAFQRLGRGLKKKLFGDEK